MSDEGTILSPSDESTIQAAKEISEDLAVAGWARAARTIREMIVLVQSRDVLVRSKTTADGDRTWYSLDADGFVTMHDTAAEAEGAARADMEDHQADAGEGWHENIADLSWGELVPHERATLVESRPAPEGADYDEWQNWALRRVKR